MNKYKGAIIEYGCMICKKFDNFFEDFSNQLSKIKSDNCEHFDFKFIYNLEKIKLKYMVSFNCKKCGKNKIVNLYNNAGEFCNIYYECYNCKNGDINVQMILSEEIIKDDNIKIKDMKPKIIKNEIKNHNNINNINNNMNQINNFGINQSINNINLIGGHANQINNNFQNNNFNFNNNIMMNNMPPINNNIMNMNIINNNPLSNVNNFNNMNINQNMNQMNMMMGNLNINNINNNQMMNNQNNNNNNSIKLIFKDTKGLKYDLFVSSLDLVFSEVIRQLFKKYSDFDEDKTYAFLRDGQRVQNHKTLGENDIGNNKIIMVIESN